MSETFHSRESLKKLSASAKRRCTTRHVGNKILKALKLLLGVFLIFVFVYEVLQGIGKLRNSKTAVSTSTYYEDGRIMPSFSICFRSKMDHHDFNGTTEVEAGLNITKYVEYVNYMSFTGVHFVVRSGFRKYEEDKLRSPACCRQENATFSPHIYGTRSTP